jgi:hypothetical protein
MDLKVSKQGCPEVEDLIEQLPGKLSCNYEDCKAN